MFVPYQVSLLSYKDYICVSTVPPTPGGKISHFYYSLASSPLLCLNPRGLEPSFPSLWERVGIVINSEPRSWIMVFSNNTVLS